MTKEQIYDKEIYPLMDQIIAICKKHKIAMLADFHIPNELDPELKCTSMLNGGEYTERDEIKRALLILRPRPTLTVFTITKE